mmetsp:Transcript_110554/g.174168  ORF Transcript_110554/g.174168 Transcript_110554/m.174168 type:complete len:773 (+) Transcript_110554:172-2490(+)
MSAEVAEQQLSADLVSSWQSSSIDLQKHGVIDLEKLLGGRVEDWSVGDFALRQAGGDTRETADVHEATCGLPKECVNLASDRTGTPSEHSSDETPVHSDETFAVSCNGESRQADQVSIGKSDEEDKVDGESPSPEDPCPPTQQHIHVAHRKETDSCDINTTETDQHQPVESGSSEQVSQLAADDKASKRKVLFNASHTSYDVIVATAEARGWRVIKNEERAGACNIHWIDDSNIGVWLPRTEPWMRVNHFPGMNNALARKSRLARNLCRMQRILPKEFSFIPPTWVLPDDLSDLSKRFGSSGEATAIYIVKPDHLCQGRGIFLTTELEKIKKSVADWREKDQTVVVQRYITRPMLIEGLKFDLRLYMLVYGKLSEGAIVPRYFLFRDGLVRMCTRPYEPPTPETFDDRCMHLTNYAINKNNKDFQQNDGDDPGVGSKRKLSWFLDYVEAEFGEKERRKLWHKLMGLCSKTLLTVHPTLEAEYSGAFPRDLTGGQLGCRCFEVLGVDVMLDAKRKPYIIEVNHLPSFTCDSPLDEDIKSRVVEQTMDITCGSLTGKDKKIYEQLVRERREGLNAPVTTPSQPSLSQDLLELAEYKDFERCYPPPASAPKLAAQCEAILARVRDVFRPVVSRRPRAASQDGNQDQVTAPRPPPLPRPPNGPPTAASSASSINATASTRATSRTESNVRQHGEGSPRGPSTAKKRSRSAPGPPRCALPPIARFHSPRIVRGSSASPPPDGTEAESGGAQAKSGSIVRVPSRQRVFLPMKNAQIML